MNFRNLRCTWNVVLAWLFLVGFIVTGWHGVSGVLASGNTVEGAFNSSLHLFNPRCINDQSLDDKSYDWRVDYNRDGCITGADTSLYLSEGLSMSFSCNVLIDEIEVGSDTVGYFMVGGELGCPGLPIMPGS